MDAFFTNARLCCAYQARNEKNQMNPRERLPTFTVTACAESYTFAHRFMPWRMPSTASPPLWTLA